jgi:hypothetical protein
MEEMHAQMHLGKEAMLVPRAESMVVVIFSEVLRGMKVVFM